MKRILPSFMSLCLLYISSLAVAAIEQDHIDWTKVGTPPTSASHSGGQGSIFIVAHAQGLLALKVGLKDPIEREYQILRELKNWGTIVHAYALKGDIQNSRSYPESLSGIFLELAKQSLEDYIDKHGFINPLTSHGRQFFKNIISTVEALHKKKILHSDLKPDNFLIFEIGQETHIKLADFGLSVSLMNLSSEFNFSALGDGTCDFLCMEASEPRYAGDIWALGVTLWKMTTRSHPLHSSFIFDEETVKKSHGEKSSPLFYSKLLTTAKHSHQHHDDPVVEVWLDLLRKLLNPDPDQREQHWERIWHHPYWNADLSRETELPQLVFELQPSLTYVGHLNLTLPDFFESFEDELLSP
jgi:serine/threonine protein kinase